MSLTATPSKTRPSITATSSQSFEGKGSRGKGCEGFFLNNVKKGSDGKFLLLPSIQNRGGKRKGGLKGLMAG